LSKICDEVPFTTASWSFDKNRVGLLYQVLSIESAAIMMRGYRAIRLGSKLQLACVGLFFMVEEELVFHTTGAPSNRICPTFNAKPSGLSVRASFFPNKDTAGGYGSTFFGVESPSYDREEIEGNSMEDDMCIRWRANSEHGAGWPLHDGWIRGAGGMSRISGWMSYILQAELIG
jgi:hypothetical protein